MDWYVKYEGTNEISGPMSKEDALQRAERADGMIFNEKIFEPEFVTSEEVRIMIAELKSIREAMAIIRMEDHGQGGVVFEGEDDAVGTVLQRVSDALILLSREKMVEATVEDGVFNVVKMSLGVRLVCRNYDIHLPFLDPESSNYDPDRITNDPSGRSCIEREFTSLSGSKIISG